ncbi:MAG TPA: AAA family ATPase, partial [Acidimicrobiales bacterium]|nr:AAA family ATPase [Acidimicrobiales bacterium]
MARVVSTHRCRSCGAVAGRWAGRCPGCGAWNSLEPWAGDRPGTGSRPGAPRGPGPVSLAEVDPDACRPRPTGLREWDRVLSGGLVAGSVTLVYGEPGAGKSTLLLQLLASLAAGGAEVLLASAEESVAQVRARAQRVGPLAAGLMVVAAGQVADVEEAVASLEPQLVVVDSV